MLSNIVLNELDWWIASQWEEMPPKHNRPFIRKDNGKTDKGPIFLAYRERSNLKECHLVRYADDFKIFCRKRSDAEKIFEATKQWLNDRLHLEISEEKSSITNLKRHYSEFLGFQLRLHKKGKTKSGKPKHVVKSHITDKATTRIKIMMHKQIKSIQTPIGNRSGHVSVDFYNSYHTRTIKESHTLNLNQIIVLIDASRGTGIYLQVLFAVLMGLRRSEINGLQYSDIDFVRQKLHISRQLGRAANCDETDFTPKTKTKQEIKLKTQSSDRVLDIPDFVFEEILKAREQYEKNRSRRSKSFQDLNYICCSSYGRPRSMQYHFNPFKEILKNNGLPDIRWHDLRHSYATLLLKNEFNLKAISKILGHAKEIVTADIYINNQEIIADGTGELKDYMEEVIPEKSREFNEKEKVFDYSGLDVTQAFDNLIA